MVELKVMEWNINQRSGFCKGSQTIPSFVGEEIKEQNADVVVLTEFYKAKNWDKFISDTFSSYHVFYTMNPNNQNDVLIAIENTHKITHVEYLYSEDGNDNPNYLRVDMIVGGIEFCVIGVRIRVKDTTKGDYKWRKKQFDLISKLVDTTNKANIPKRFVILGDFNNSRILETKEAYKGKLTEFYNYHLIGTEFEKIGLEVRTPKEGFSWGGYIKNDHIVVTKNINVLCCDYCWKFTEKHEVYKVKEKHIPIGYPDHAILTAKIALNEEEV